MSSKIKNEMTLKMMSDDVANLCRNGVDMCCPYVQPTVFPQSSGEVLMMRTSCSSMCPLFEIKENGKKVQINCGAKVIHTISKIIPLTQPNKKVTGIKMILKPDKTVN